MSKAKKIYFVMAEWCPHCQVSKKYIEIVSRELNIPCISLNIDNKNEEKIADEIVKKYGDWSEDYLIPQVFIELENGKIKHILTGKSEGINYTVKEWENFLKSKFYHSLKSKK